MWEDIVLAASNWVLLAALIPTVLHKTQKPTFLTSIATALALTAITITYAAISLWYAALAAGLMAGAWFLLAYQRYQLNKNRQG